MKKQDKTFSLLLCCNGLANLGHYAAYGLLAIYLINTVHLRIETVSIILLFFAITLRIARIFFAPCIDILSIRYAMFISMLICAIGYILLPYSQSISVISFALLIISIGYGTNSLIVRSITSFLSSNSHLSRYAMLNMITNLAAAIGPVIGNLFMLKYPQYGFCLFSASIFTTSAIIVWIFPLDISQGQITPHSWFREMFQQLYSKKIRSTLFITIMVWFLLAQIFSLIPIYVSKGLLSQNLLGTVYLVNSLVIALFSLPVVKWITYQNLSLYWQFIISFSLFFIGFLVLASWQNLIGLYLTLIIWSFSEVIATPALSLLVISTTNQNIRLVGFAVNAIAMGIGEGIGNFVGINLAGYSYNNHSWSTAFSILALLILCFIFFILINFKNQEVVKIQEDRV